jgi:hypothetical protein
MSGARGCVVLFGAVIALAGIGWLMLGSAEAPGFPAIPALILGCVTVVTALAEPVYGKLVGRPSPTGNWRPTGEKFIDPATGKPVEVWFEPKTGERRYVDVGKGVKRS